MIERFIKNELSLKRWRRFKKNRVAMISLVALLIITFFSFTAELWANSSPLVMKYNGQLFFPAVKDYHPTQFGRDDILVMDYRSLQFEGENWAVWPLVQWDPLESNKDVSSYPSEPTKKNIFGTDDRGRDVFARLLYGFRYTIAYSFGVWLLCFICGTVLGAFVGYMGGWPDLFGSRAVEVIEMTPQLLLLITIISIFSPSLLILVIFSFLFGWTPIYHQMRAQFLQLRKREYVEAARAIGASHWRIISKYILPNAITPLVTFTPFVIAANVYQLAILDYLGLGLRPPTPSWGEFMVQAQKYVTIAQWLVWFPSAALLITMTALINIGVGVRDAFDART